MSFWCNFTHGFMHGVFDRMLWGGMPFWGCNNFAFFSPIFMSPTPYFSNFDSMPPLPVTNFNFKPDPASLWKAVNEQQPKSEFKFDFSRFSNADFYNNYMMDTFQRSKSPKGPSVKNDDTAFDKMLEFVFKAEGGYVANDGGEAGNLGVRQSVYDKYRKDKGLAAQDVKSITRDEAKEIYYDMYYKASGADKIADARLAFQVFDTAVNMGVSRAKTLLEQSGGDADKFKQLRLERYESIARNNPNKAKYLDGWKNRVNNLSDFAEENFTAVA